MQWPLEKSVDFNRAVAKTATMKRMHTGLPGVVTAIFLGAHGMVLTGEGTDAAGKPAAADGFIDVHMHLSGVYRPAGGQAPQSGPQDGVRHPPPGSGPKGMKGGPPGQSGPVKDYETAADNLVAMMDRLGVAKAVVMPPPQSPGQAGGYTCHDLLGAIRKHPDRLTLAAGGGELSPIITQIEPSAVTPAVRADFERKALEMIRDGAKAFGEMAALHFSFSEGHIFKQIPADHPLFLLLADIAARENVPIDLHMEVVPVDQLLPQSLARIRSNNPPNIEATIPPFERLLAHNRNARIVWQHIGWDNTGHMTIDLLRRLLDAHPNLYLALKFVKKAREPWQRGNKFAGEDLRILPEWVSLMSDYPDRFMVGADEFVGIPDKTPTKGPPSFEDTWSIIRQLPPGLQAKVGRDNAARVYRLE